MKDGTTYAAFTFIFYLSILYLLNKDLEGIKFWIFIILTFCLTLLIFNWAEQHNKLIDQIKNKKRVD